MTFDPDKFGDEYQTSGLHRASRQVDTPMPENSDGSGHTTEGNHMYYYRHGDEYFKLSKVSDNGWSVWRYVADPEEGIIPLRRHGHSLNAQEAHRMALRNAVERSS
jgi:hypothetical protein